MSKNHEIAFEKFAKKWLSTVFKEEENVDKFGPLPQNYADLRDGARLVLLFTLFLMRAQKTVDIDNGKRPLFVFVTKKGYWLYRCVYQHLYLLPKESYPDCHDFWNTIQVKSDRYFTKSPDVSQFADCLLFIIDDIVHTGANFQRMKQLVMDNSLTIAKYIAFAIEDCGEALAEELKDVWACSKLSSNDLGRVSMEEIILFHSLGVPYTIDLPVLKVKGTAAAGEDCSFFSGRLSEDEFNQLYTQCIRYGWRRADAPYKLNNRHFKTCFFWNPANPLERKFKNLLHSLIVECNYCEIELDQGEKAVNVTFVPFAIMRSVKWQELIVLFSAAFGQTPYCSSISSFLRASAEPSQALATALYRSIVFYLSGYIAAQFNIFLHSIGLSLELQTDHMQEHWNQDFMESVKDIFSSASSPAADGLPLVNCTSLLDFYRSDDILSDPKYWNTDIAAAPQNWKLNTYFEMYKFFVKSPGFDKTDYHSFENLEIEIARQAGKLVNDLKFKEDFLQALTKLLNQSAISNIVLYDKASDKVIRGFRAGENGALLLPYAQPEAFCAIFAYYGRCERLSGTSGNADQQFKHHFDYFKWKFLDYIDDTGYDYWIDREETIQLLEYFKNLSNIGRQIKNRQYIVEDLEQDGSPLYALIAKNLREFVENLELPNE